MPLLSITTTDLWVCILCYLPREYEEFIANVLFHVAGVVKCLSAA